MKDIQKLAGARFKARRELLKKSQDEIAHACGVATSTIQRFEAGTLNATLSTLIPACAALDLPIGALFDDSPLAPARPTPAEALDVLRELVHQKAEKPPSAMTKVEIEAELRAIDERGSVDGDQPNPKLRPAIRSQRKA